MSRANEVAEMIVDAFPGVRVGSTDRTPQVQAALVRAGKTRAVNSQHLRGMGIDISLPANVSPAAIRSFLKTKGITPGEFMMESGKGKNQGTGPHLHIGLAPRAGSSAPAKPNDTAPQSTYDRVSAKRSADTGPSLDGMFQARMKIGKPGGMSQQEAAQFDAWVNSGGAMPPRWYKTAPPPNSIPLLPQRLIDAYNSHEMDDDPAGRAEVERSVAAGEARLPKGMTLTKPAARTLGEKVGMYGRAAAKGVADLADQAAGAITGSTLANAVAAPFRSPEENQAMAGVTAPAGMAVDTLGNALGAPLPESPSEKMISAGVGGAAQGLMLGPVGGVENLLKNTAVNAVSGFTSGVSGEKAQEAGAGPIGQFAAALAGGLVPVGAAGAAERAIGRKTLPDFVAETPPEAVFEPSGDLTPEGREAVVRYGVSPDDLRTAYEAPPSVQNRTANDTAQPAVAKAVNDGELPPVAEMTPEAAAASEAPLESSFDAAFAKSGSPEVPATDAATPATVPTTALDRVQAAGEFGVPLTRGEATKNFDIQDAEQRLKNMNSPEGEKMRAFIAAKNEKIKVAVDDFKASVGDASLTPEERGIKVQDAVRGLRDQGQKGVSELYKQARDMGAPVELDTSQIKNTYERLMVEADVPDTVKNVLTQEAARYGLIGKPEVIDKATGAVTSENGITKVRLDNGEVKPFYGAPQKLGLDNAEEFRQAVSKQYMADGGQKLTTVMKKAVDDAVEEAVTRAAGGEATGDVGAAFKKAREAHKAQVETFKAKDLVQSIADWKRGVQTGVLKPEQVMQRALATVSDLKRIKAVLLTKPTVASSAAWTTIKAHGLATIFDKATVRNSNIAGEITEAISGAKLRTAMEAFGIDKLKVLLDAKEFAQLMKLRRVIEDATVPISGTTNPSGTGNLLMRMSAQVIGRFPLGGGLYGRISEPIAALWRQAKEIAEAQKTLAGTDYTPAAAKAETATSGVSPKRPGMAKAIKDKGATFVREFIDIYKSPRVLAPIIAAGESEKDQ